MRPAVVLAVARKPRRRLLPGTHQALAQVRAPLYEDKVVDYILELADVAERTITPDEMLAAVSEAGVTGKVEPAAEAPAAT